MYLCEVCTSDCMSERFYIYLSLPDYLQQWYVNECKEMDENAVEQRDTKYGVVCVMPPKGSQENRILQCFLQKRPAVAADTDNPNIAIAIPHFAGKDPFYYNYLGANGRDMFKNAIRTRFSLQLWECLHDFSNVFGRQDKTIDAFMESHGIACTETNWNAIAKIYQRLRHQYYKKESRKKVKKKV